MISRGQIIWKGIAGCAVIAIMGVAFLPRYAVSSAGNGFVWRVNTLTGNVSLCRGGELLVGPVCGPWAITTVQWQANQPAPSQPPAKPQKKISDEEFQRLLDNVK